MYRRRFHEAQSSGPAPSAKQGPCGALKGKEDTLSMSLHPPARWGRQSGPACDFVGAWLLLRLSPQHVGLATLRTEPAGLAQSKQNLR